MRALDGLLVGTLLALLPAEAMAVIVKPGRIRPDGFYAVPENRVRTLLDKPGQLEAKLRRTRWGPRNMTHRPPTSTGQWYLFPVCGAIIVTRSPNRQLVEPTDSEVTLSCP